MFRQFARLPLRRCLHSQTSASPRTFARHNRSAYALGASVAVAGYLAWSLSSNGRHLSLDAEPVPTPKKRPAAPKTASSQPPDAPTPSTPSASQNDALPELDTTSPESEKPSESTPEAPETPAEGEGEQGESSAGGAFNPETGEINWDCPCLGGMAHGPCGEQFREAFSCFVHSEAEPKGVDCVGKFKAMQDCFREHPDVYGDEIMDDDDDDEELPAGAVTTDSENPEGQTTLADTLSAKTSEHESPSPSS